MKGLFTFLICSASIIYTQAQDLKNSKESAHGAPINAVAINSDVSMILTGGGDKRAQLWDVKSGNKIKVFGHSAPVKSVAYSANGKLFATASADGKILVFDAKESKVKKILTKEHTGAVQMISFNPINDYIVSASADGTAKTWDGKTGGSQFTLRGHGKSVNAAVFSPDGRSVATGSADQTIKLWDASTGKLKNTIEADSKEITSLIWSSDGKYLASGGSGGAVVIWEMPAGTRAAETNFKSQVNTLAFSPDVKYLVAGGNSKKMIVWNLETKEVAKEFQAHDDDVYATAFSDKDNLLITAGKDMALKIWDVLSLDIGKKKYMKDEAEPKLSTLNVALLEDNRNGIIENPEKPKITFTLKNSGKGQAYNLIAKTSIESAIVGLHFEKEVLIGNLEGDKYTTVTIPIYTDSTIESAGGTFKVEIVEGNGHNAKPIEVHFQSRGGVSYSYIMVASHAYSSATGKAEPGAPITLKLKLKNTSSGDARNIKLNYILPPKVMAVNKLSEFIPELASGQEKEVSMEFYASKDFTKSKLVIGLNLEGAYTNANDLILEVKMNEPLPTTELAIAMNTEPVEMPEQPLYRGSGDPLKGLNVSKSKEMVIGKYYALIIGIDKYKGVWTPLQNAVNDAKAIESLLKTKYKFDHFKVLYNEQATRAKIIGEMEWLLANAQPQDNVFIYYSGHGEYKKNLNKGFWVPVDATTNSTVNYISNSDLQNYLGGVKSKHTLLVADACFSGDIFRGNTVSVPFENSEKYYKEVHNLASRQALTSGGVEPVMDGGRDGHSVFAYYLLKILKENNNKYMDATQIYNRIKIPVINNSEQSPKLAPVKNTGDEGGQFLFIKK